MMWLTLGGIKTKMFDMLGYSHLGNMVFYEK